MNKRAAQRLNDVALNILDLAHCLHTGSANEISLETWWDQFARDKDYEAARKQWLRWRKDLVKHGIAEQVEDGRENHVILKPEAVNVAEALRAEAQAVLAKGEKPGRAYPDHVTVAGQTYHLKVYGRAVRPLTDREYADLRTSVEGKGVEVSVLVDRANNVVDGKHRLMIAGELGFEDVPITVLETDDQEYLEDLAEELNSCRRQFTRKQVAELKRQRQARAEAKRAAGMSLRQIAEEEGVTRTTIQKDLEDSDERDALKVRGKDGALRPAHKSSREEAAARRQRIAELLADDEYEELSVREIAEQLGVSPRTVQRDIKALGARGSDESESERTSDPDFGIVVQEVGTGETWRGVDRESAPLGTCLEVAIDCLDQLRQRLDDPELVELAEAARGFVDSVVWRLMEGAAA